MDPYLNSLPEIILSRPTLRELIPPSTPNRLVEGGGFEPPKLTRQIYSLIPLATREPLQNEALDSAFEVRPCQMNFGRKDLARSTGKCLIWRVFLLITGSSESIPKERRPHIIVWCRHQESNSGPTDYKSVALPAEL